MLTPEQIDNMRIVMVRTRNPLNVGAVARAMSNFGFLNLRMVQPYDAAFREARSAVDAEQVLTAAEEFQDVARAVADCSLVVGTTAGGVRRHTLEPIQRLETGAAIIRRHLQSGEKVAMLFGSEKVGLSNDDLNHCQILLRIPTRTEHLSMNLGQSVAVSLYELVRDSTETYVATGARLATAEERERFLAVLLQALSLSNYVPHGTQFSTEQRLRRLFRHVPVTQRDLQEWLGLIRQIVWRLDSFHSELSQRHE